MSLFRKPTKRMQRRVFTNEDDEELNGEDDDGGMNMVAPPPPVIKQKKKESSDQYKPKQALLSFGDELEDEGEIFRVKKSSHSKKLSKRRERPPPPLGAAAPPPPAPSLASAPPENPPANNSRDNDTLHKSSSIQSSKKSIEGLILSGRAALSAGLHGDLPDSDEGSEGSQEDEDADREDGGRFKHAFSKSARCSVRQVLDSGAIPDAALIHEARKKRQRARETADIIPLHTSQPPQASSVPSALPAEVKRGSRLVREDGEGDGDDEDEDRIQVRGVEKNRRDNTDHQDLDADSGGEEWEIQQIRKAVTQNQIIDAQQERYYGNQQYMMPTITMADPSELNLFSMTPAAPNISGTAAHLRPLAPTGHPPLSCQDFHAALLERFQNLTETKTAKKEVLRDMDADMSTLKETTEACSKKAPKLAGRYEFYQKLRGYITDLVECLDEKMPALEALEARAMALQKKQAAFLMERRRTDVRDQAQEILNPTTACKRDGMDEERARRCAEREGRRVRRRRARQKEANPAIIHMEGDSSDNELPPGINTMGHEQLISDASNLFSDTLEEFSSLASVLSRWESWRSKDRAAYVDAYAGLCLPRLAGPYLRLKLLLWNPITDENAPDWEKMPWYRGLMLYGLSEDLNNPETEESLAEDPDTMLIPNIVLKVIIPKLAELVEGTWDPVSGSQSRRLAALLRQAGALVGATPSSRQLQALATAVIKRATLALQHDVFIPILPESIIKKSGEMFLKRQAASGARLLCNLTALHGIIADSALVPLVLTSLLQRYLLSAVRCCPPVFGAWLCWAMASCLPRAWVQQKPQYPALEQFTAACQGVLAALHTDNPLHLKPLEQIRSTLAILQNSTSKETR